MFTGRNLLMSRSSLAKRPVVFVYISPRPFPAREHCLRSRSWIRRSLVAVGFTPQRLPAVISWFHPGKLLCDRIPLKLDAANVRSHPPVVAVLCRVSSQAPTGRALSSWSRAQLRRRRELHLLRCGRELQSSSQIKAQIHDSRRRPQQSAALLRIAAVEAPESPSGVVASVSSVKA
ncbi:hypothetical protein DY000_02020369 [Brassica cretica]|uniref:Uncharacterized protein n=1 Tax=Brassica cretica TaxID=69181 RepID=A0ABQ7EDF1_BRACR|nr:hypothetical protein DY000_02020369 [Brassica cretica]